MTPYAMLPLNAAVASVRLTGYTVTSNLRFLQECGRATLRLNPFFALAKPVVKAHAVISELPQAQMKTTSDMGTSVAPPPAATATDPKPSASKPATVAKAKPAQSRAVKSEPKAKPKSKPPRKPSPPPSMPT